MSDIAGSMRRTDVLERCAGMNGERAGRLVDLLPELGRVSTAYAVRLAGLSPAHAAKGKDMTKRKVLPIRRVLAECMKEALRDKGGKLAGFLRHLAETHGTDRTRVCLAATLRWYSDKLRHPAAISAAAGTAYPEADDEADLLAAENEPDP